jgi:anti-sigma-K factor RskA
LLELLPAEQPPYAIWRAIETRLGLVPPPRRNVPADTGGPARWFANLNFWRGWSIAATAVAVLALVLAVRPLLPGNNPTGNPGGTGQNAPVAENRIGYVAVLNDQQSRAMMLVTWDDAHSQMTVRRLFDTPDPADKSMELWGLPSNGNPVALGVLPPGGEVTLKMAHRPQNYPVLAISVEPKGGSPNPNGPTGPVIFTGKLVATT